MEPEINSDNGTIPDPETRSHAPGTNVDAEPSTIGESFSCIQKSLTFVYAKSAKDGQVRSIT